ncbi:hypothetical protein LCGC14_2823110 [marine sediment metagenome]|uniref:Uncharacterized protein n=1 Tax=marine sediment metagenome TaxID=412755 RepID=A0A0F8Z353_9ZZZZ
MVYNNAKREKHTAKSLNEKYGNVAERLSTYFSLELSECSYEILGVTELSKETLTLAVPATASIQAVKAIPAKSNKGKLYKDFSKDVRYGAYKKGNSWDIVKFGL